MPLSYRFLNEQPVESGLRFHVDERTSFADVTHSLSIENTEVEDAGTVKALAVNKAGQATTEAKLFIDGDEHSICQFEMHAIFTRI